MTCHLPKCRSSHPAGLPDSRSKPPRFKRSYAVVQLSAAKRLLGVNPAEPENVALLHESGLFVGGLCARRNRPDL